MIPVRTARSNFVFRGPSPDVGDAWVDRQPAHGEVWVIWKPDEAELAAIAGGGLIRLGIYTTAAIPPVSLDVTDQVELSADGAALRDRAKEILQALNVPGPTAVPPGHWSVADDVWSALLFEGALENVDGTPTLFGRPLARGGMLPGGMVFVPAGERES